MIQLDNRRKVLILIASVVLIIIFIFIFIFIKNNKNNKLIGNSVTNNQQNTSSPRIMTESEKIERVGIVPSQDAEVVTDSNGLYVYKIKK